jgi:BirA family biotin operon repressor/biotin-[acetyl-CoA-carboxylase] ligase
LKTLLDKTVDGVSVTDLAGLLEVSKKNVKFEIGQLREAGFVITGIKKIILKDLPDNIQPPLLKIGLRTKKFGREIYSFKSIGSTNETAKRLAGSNSAEGTVVVAEKQTRGKGRLGRSWHSPASKGLYFSVILYPNIPLIKIPALSLAAGLAVCKVLEKNTGAESLAKWPNDCLINGKKAAGILLETSAEIDNVSYVILGIGVNVNTPKKDFPIRFRSKATSMMIESNKEYSRIEILRQLLFELEKTYNSFCKYGLRFIGPELVKKSAVLNRKLEFKSGGKKLTGTAIGFDENGALRVKVGKSVKILSAGEVTLRK